MYKFLMVVEKAPSNYSAYCPDLPGCVATGATIGEVEENMREAIKMHIEAMQEDKLPIPEPATRAEYVMVDVG